MAKIVLAGPANDPYFPRCELLADQLKAALPAFDIYKVSIQPSEWDEWLQNTCSKFGWRRTRETKGPIIWRELVNRGGRATLIGDSNDFQEFCRTYYGLKSNLTTNYMLRVAAENQNWTDIKDVEEKDWFDRQKPVVVTVWNAAADASQLVLAEIAKGGVLPFSDMELRLAAAPWISSPASRLSGEDLAALNVRGNSSLESVVGDSSSLVEQMMSLEAIQADIEDMACGNVRRIVNCGGNGVAASVGATLIIVVLDENCNTEAMEETFKTIGRDLENTISNAKSDSNNNSCNVRVLFVPGSIECMTRTTFRLASKFVTGIVSTIAASDETDPFASLEISALKTHKFAVDPAKVLCLTTPLENAAKSLVAKQLNLTTPFVNNVVVWSRPPEQIMFPWPFFVDITQANVAEHRGAIEGPAPFTRPVMDLLAHERKFIAGINDAVALRYSIGSGKALALSAGVTDFLRGWFGGAEKLPHLLIEQHRRKLVFSVGLCEFFVPGTPEVEPTIQADNTQQLTASVEQPKATETAIYKSLPIRFSGRDDLEGYGYIIASDLQPPPEMFAIPQPPKTDDVPIDEAAALGETINEGNLEDTLKNEQNENGLGDDGVAAAMAANLDESGALTDTDQPLLN